MSSFRYHFVWDAEKAAVNSRKHGVNFEDAAPVITDPLAVTLYDEEHSETEERWVTLGAGADGSLMVVVHTFEEINPVEATVRIISARPATNAERRDYEDR
jgi:uncharacterized DUF497 family protein